MVAVVIPLLASLVICWVLGWNGCFSGSDHRFDDQNVKGLTPNEVIARFGTPYVDPRTEPGWAQDYAAGRPLVLGYRQGWRNYVLVFRDGKVDHVERSQK